MNLVDFLKYKITPHYYFEIQKNNYLIKIANKNPELEQALKLRHKVFSQVASGFTGQIDVDDFDKDADHLVVIDLSKNEVVGTYRFLLSDKVRKHYSEREFDLTEFLKLSGRKLELGRASVSTEARAGVIITLLWRGIAEYLKITQADYLFGCSSIWAASDENIKNLSSVLMSKGLTSDTPVSPLETHWPLPAFGPKEKFTGYIEAPELTQAEQEKMYDDLVPTLVKTYIHVGAKFAIPPAFDRKLKAYEFFGFVETSKINPSFRKKYLEVNS